MKARVLFYCLLGGLPVTIAALGAGHFAWWWLSGILLAAAFVPVALFGPQKALGQFAVIAPALLIVTVLCLWSEALIFLPDLSTHPFRDLAASVVLYLLLAAVLAALFQLFKLSHPIQIGILRRSVAGAAGMVLLSGFAYVLYYLVFGTITYQYFTKGYFPGVERLVGRLGLWFWVIQLARGVLMTLAVLPAIYTLRMKRWQAAIVAGLIIWIAGGVAPLVVPSEIMGPRQRFIHVIEIFTQNFSLGVTAALLLRLRSAPVAASQPVPAAGPMP